MSSDQGHLFEEDRVGNYRKEYKHHGLEPLGIKRGQGGAPLNKFSSLSLPVENTIPNRGVNSTTGYSFVVERRPMRSVGSTMMKKQCLEILKNRKDTRRKVKM